MSDRTFIAGTRGSSLAVAQTNEILKDLKRKNAEVKIDIKIIKTTGDRIKDQPWGELNLKGAFTKELDDALLRKEIDFAVHSLKDLPSEIPSELAIHAITTCVDPRDALVSKAEHQLKDLPQGAKVGTSSLRRAALIRKARPDLSIQVLRGNVDTRLKKLDSGEFDAIVIAAAGLKRLGKESRVAEYLDPFQFVPAVGQGKLAVVGRRGDAPVTKLLRPLDDLVSHQIALGERMFMKEMEGGCQVPLGCYGESKGDQCVFVGFLSAVSGRREIQRSVEGPLADSERLGLELAEAILKAGGRDLMNDLKSGTS